MIVHRARPSHRLTLAAVLVALTTLPAYAAGSNMPWEQPLNQILQSVEGPVSKIIAVIIIVTTGLTLAFGDTSGGFRRLIQRRPQSGTRIARREHMPGDPVLETIHCHTIRIPRDHERPIAHPPIA